MIDSLPSDSRTLEIEKKRITLIRSGGDQGQLLTAMREAAGRFPEEASFQQNLKRQLETMGLVYESLAVQQALVDKEPENTARRTQLATLWAKLEHPVNAAKAREAPQAGRVEVVGRCTKGTRSKSACSASCWGEAQVSGSCEGGACRGEAECDGDRRDEA